MLQVKRDPQIELPKVRAALENATSEELGGNAAYNTIDLKQTSVYGIRVPIISFNNFVVGAAQLIYFELNMTDLLPTAEAYFYDNEGWFEQYNKAGADNTMQVILIPASDTPYKNINMLFYVTEQSIQNKHVHVRGTYKIPGLINKQWLALGEKTTYELCDLISSEALLGFATNTEATDDKRFIYCDDKNYGEMLRNEIKNSFADETHVYDCWIDPWNYIVLCDMYERFNTKDDIKDLNLWISTHNVTGYQNEDPTPVQTDSVLTNHPARDATELHIREYKNVPSNISTYKGSQKALTVYDMNTKEYVGHYIAKSDAEKDNFIASEYGGEVYGDYNYILSKQCRDMFMDKLHSNVIEVTLTSPVFGLCRGDQCRIVWFDNNPKYRYWRDTLNALELANDPSKMDLGWLGDWIKSVKGVQDDTLFVNLQVSGQYTIIGQRAIFDRNKWSYILTLTRPSDRIPQMLNIPEDDGSN